jgi:hypothetical protein
MKMKRSAGSASFGGTSMNGSCESSSYMISGIQLVGAVDFFLLMEESFAT